MAKTRRARSRSPDLRDKRARAPHRLSMRTNPAAAEEECLLEYRARAHVVAGCERHTGETAERHGARPARGTRTRNRRRLGVQTSCSGQISTREFDARLQRGRIGSCLLVVSAATQTFQLVGVAQRVVEGATME